MTTRPRSNSRLALVLALCAASAPAAAQPRAPAVDEAEAHRAHYDVARWAAPGPLHAGVSLARLTPTSLRVRARVDRLARDGGIVLSFGTATATTVQLRLAVAADADSARQTLLGYLRTAQATLVPLRMSAGADVAFGDSADGADCVAAAFGNVAVSIARTTDAGAETPSAADLLRVVASSLAPAGTLVAVAPTLSVAPVPSASGSVHLTLSGVRAEHVEARVRGGHLRGAPLPTGMEVVPSGRGSAVVSAVVTDPLGRTYAVSATVSPPATPVSPARRITR